MIGEDSPGVAEVFGNLRRFHVYDHEEERWVLSGCQFGEGGPCAVKHADYDEELQKYRYPGLTASEPEYSVVREDGEDRAIEEAAIPLDAASDVAGKVIEELAEHLDVDCDRVRVVQLQAPNLVEYFVTGPDAGELVE